MLCSLYACVWYYQTIHVHVYIIEINVVCCVGRVEIEIEITFRALALRQRETNFSDEGPMLETLDYTIRIGSTLTILYFDVYIIVRNRSICNDYYLYSGIKISWNTWCYRRRGF